jgi:hypothetical protein
MLLMLFEKPPTDPVGRSGHEHGRSIPFASLRCDATMRSEDHNGHRAEFMSTRPRKCSKPHPVPTVQLLKDMARGVPHPPLSVRAATEATGPQNLKLFAAFPS